MVLRASLHGALTISVSKGKRYRVVYGSRLCSSVDNEASEDGKTQHGMLVRKDNYGTGDFIPSWPQPCKDRMMSVNTHDHSADLLEITPTSLNSGMHPYA